MPATIDHPIAEPARSPFSTWIGVVLLFVVFALFVWVVIGATPRGDTYEEKRGTVRVDKLKAARDEANGALTTYAYTDKAKGLVHVPIERAMELAMAELAQKKPVPANPIASPAGPSAATLTGAAAPASAPAATPQPRPDRPNSMQGSNSEIKNQPTGAANPPNAQPGTQPGAKATPAAAPSSQAGKANLAPSPSTTPMQKPAGTPLPVPGKTP